MITIAKMMITQLNMSRTDFNYSKFYQKWSRFQAVLNLAGMFLALHFGTLFWVVSNVIMFVVYIVQIPRSTTKGPAIIGYANLVTAFRAFGVLALLAMYDVLSSSLLFSLFLLCIILDGLDGYLARKYRTSSETGSNFDMETDAMLVFVLSWMNFKLGNLHWLIIIPGAFKYINELIIKPFDLNCSEYLSKRVRATIAVSFFISLILPFLSDHYGVKLLVYASGIMILFSFLSAHFYKSKTVNS